MSHSDIFISIIIIFIFLIINVIIIIVLITIINMIIIITIAIMTPSLIICLLSLPNDCLFSCPSACLSIFPSIYFSHLSLCLSYMSLFFILSLRLFVRRLVFLSLLLLFHLFPLFPILFRYFPLTRLHGNRFDGFSCRLH